MHIQRVWGTVGVGVGVGVGMGVSVLVIVVMVVVVVVVAGLLRLRPPNISLPARMLG